MELIKEMLIGKEISKYTQSPELLLAYREMC